MNPSSEYFFEDKDDQGILRFFHHKSIVIYIIIHLKKLLDSDWPRAVQFKYNTSALSPREFSHVCIITK